MRCLQLYPHRYTCTLLCMHVFSSTQFPHFPSELYVYVYVCMYACKGKEGTHPVVRRLGRGQCASVFCFRYKMGKDKTLPCRPSYQLQTEAGTLWPRSALETTRELRPRQDAKAVQGMSCVVSDVFSFFC